MKAVRHLRSAGGAVACALGICTRPIPCDHLHARVLPQPLRDRLGGPLWEQGHGLVALQDRAIGVPFPQGEIVHPQHGGRGERRGRVPTEQAQERVPAHGEAPTLADLPWAAYRVRLQLRVRKWFCRNPCCGRRIFTERLPTVAAPWARRTLRLAQRLVAVA